MSSMLAFALLLLELPSLAQAYSWSFSSPPQQCANLTIQVSGGGTPPYRVLIVPFGPTPLGNSVEARKVMDVPFNNNDNSVSFKLNYPANSQLVAVVSDATGFGSGGTSVAAQVASSSDASCFDSSKSVQAPWTYSLSSGLAQCTATRIFWNTPQAVQGTPTFLGVIPGGESFQIQATNIDDESHDGQGTGFSYTPNLRAGTTLILVVGDNRGNGSAGSNVNSIGNNLNNDNSCLNSNSPSSTPGDPAGGSYPTSSTGAGTGSGGGGGGGSNVGAIVGGVVGGVVLLLAILLLLLFFHRRRKLHKRHSEKPDLLVADDDDPAPTASRNELPQFYQPEPFLVPEPSESGHTGTDSDARRQSYVSHSGTDLLSASGPSSTTTRKGGYQPRQMRPVNIIQHDDAGPSVPETKEDEAETIELPPAYTNIRPAATPPTETTPAPAQAAA